MSGRPVRAALIGYGYWGRRLLAITGRVDSLEVVQVVDERSGTDGFEPPAELPCHAGLEAVLDDADVEAVLVTVPSVGHADVVTRALRAGKHVFVEKPLATTAPQARALVALARESGLMLTVDQQYWWSAEVAALSTALDSGLVGPVAGISVQRVSGGPQRQDVNAWWDLACHDVGVLTRIGLMGADVADAWNVRGSTTVADGPVAGCVVLSARSREGVEFWAHLCWMSATRRRRLVVAGVTGNLALEEDDHALSLWLERDRERSLLSQTPKASRGTPIESALDAFAQGVRGPADLRDAALAADVVTVLEYLDDAAAPGRIDVKSPGCWL